MFVRLSRVATLFVSLLLLLTLFSTSGAQDNNNTQVVVFRDQGTLTLYVPGNQVVDIDGLTFEVVDFSGNAQVYALDSFPAFIGIPLDRLLAPACFSLQTQQSTSPLPLECQSLSSGQLFVQRLPDANIFWRNNATGQDFTVSLTRGPDVFGVCPAGQSRCDITVTSAAEATVPPVDDTPEEPDMQSIAFIGIQAVTEGSVQIYSVDVMTGLAAQLTTAGGSSFSPAFSPDGSQIAYVYESGDDADIYVMNADGTNVRQLTSNDANDFDPVWSPDGEQIAFASYEDGDAEIFVMNSDGTNKRQLTNNIEVDDYQPAWAPTGSEIVYVSERDGDPEILIMNNQGTNVRQLTNNSVVDEQPYWLLSGRDIAFISRRDGGDADIFVMNSEGVNVRQLTANNAEEWLLRWTPETAQLAYLTGVTGELTINVLTIDGSGGFGIGVNVPGIVPEVEVAPPVVATPTPTPAIETDEPSTQASVSRQFPCVATVDPFATASILNVVRQFPNPTSQIINSVRRSSEVTVIEVSAGAERFYRVQQNGQTLGWIASEYLVLSTNCP